MKKTFGLFGFLFLLASGLSFAEQNFKDMQDMGRWMTYYYENPEPAKVMDALIFADSSKLFDDSRRMSPMVGFVAGAVSKNPELAEILSSSLPRLSEKAQQVVVLGVWYSDYPGASQVLSRIQLAYPSLKSGIDALLASKRLSVFDVPLERGPWVLDMLWGNFMATGDSAPVVRLISALPWSTAKGDVGKLLVGGAAKWSLRSNAAQHARVLAVCRSEADLAKKGLLADLLREVISGVTPELRK